MEGRHCVLATFDADPLQVQQYSAAVQCGALHCSSTLLVGCRWARDPSTVLGTPCRAHAVLGQQLEGRMTHMLPSGFRI